MAPQISSRGKLYAGTPGYGYKHWKGVFYPDSLARTKWLPYYAERYAALEINATFYRTFGKHVFERWSSLTPDNFTFVIKGPKSVTRDRRLKDPAGELAVFFDGAEGLGDKLGCVIWQMPPSFKLEEETLERLNDFLGMLPTTCRHDVAFPKLNLLSLYLYALGASVGVGALLLGGVDTGWTFYAPLSSTYSNGMVTWVIVGAFLAGFSSILTGLNFIVTIHKMRAPGLTWFRLPLFIWSIYSASLIQVLGTPVVAITLLLVVMEKVLGVGVFDPKLGGDPVLFQHLFWFYSHPAVYIMILPAFACISEVIACFARKPIYGYKFVAFSSIAIAVFGFLVWGHHMFVSSQSPYAGMVFSLLSFLVAIPSAVKVFNWTATIYKGSIHLTTPMMYALAFMGLFTIGGLTGLHCASMATDVYLHDTYFVIAHFHYVMVGGTTSAYLAGLHFWWPKMTGRMYSEAWGKASALILFIGFNMTFFPQFLLGMWGMHRRYHAYPPEFQFLNIMSSAGATILAVGYGLPFLYLLWSLKYGPRVTNNPWHATRLEWQTTSPPPVSNFATIPIVTSGPYADDAVESERIFEKSEAIANEVNLGSSS